MEHESRSSNELPGENSSGEPKADQTGSPGPFRPQRQTNLGVRKDKHRLHAMRHAVLSKFPLQALARLGENTRSLRRMERELRAEVKPSGRLANLLFDRFWSCYLHCLLAARMQSATLFRGKGSEAPPAQTPNLVEGELPTLIWNSNNENANETLPPDLFQQLTLVQRYDTSRTILERWFVTWACSHYLETVVKLE